MKARTLAWLLGIASLPGAGSAAVEAPERCSPEALSACAPGALLQADRALHRALAEGEFAEAAEALARLEALADASEPGQTILLHSGRGEYHFHRGEPSPARQAFAQARQIALAADMDAWADALAIDEGIALRDEGALWAALTLLEQVRTDAPSSYRLDANLATLYAQLGAADLAAELLSGHLRRLGSEDAPDAAVRLAQLKLDAGRPGDVLRLLEQAGCQAASCAPGQMPALLRWWALELRAEALRREGRLEEARAAFLALREILPEGGDRALADIGLARVAVDDGEWVIARTHIDAALAAEPDVQVGWTAHALRTRDPEGTDQAIAALEAALPEILAGNTLMSLPEHRLRLRLEVLEALLEAWLRRGTAADLARAHALLPELQSLSPGLAPDAGSDPATPHRSQAPGQAIRERQLGQREQALWRAGLSEAPAGAAGAASVASADTAHLQWLIHDRHALLRHGERLWSVPISIRESDLANHVALLIANDPAWRVTGARLYRQLGGELLDQLCREGTGPHASDDPACPRPGVELVIRVGPRLVDFPFATLVDGEGELLLQRFAIRLDDRIPGRAQLSGSRALVVAHSAAGLPTTGRWWERLGRVPEPLAEVRAEASEVARDWSARVLLAEGAATAEHVSAALRDTPNVLHIAAHAVMNPWRPRHSALLIAPSAAGNPWWEAAAIARTPMDVELVVLSACRSARRGAPWRGGFGGLADAFLRAGAKAVVGSLWSVEDAETRAVMRAFYGRLPAEPIASALRQTQLALISEGRPAATWAGWVLRD